MLPYTSMTQKIKPLCIFSVTVLRTASIVRWLWLFSGFDFQNDHIKRRQKAVWKKKDRLTFQLDKIVRSFVWVSHHMSSHQASVNSPGVKSAENTFKTQWNQFVMHLSHAWIKARELLGCKNQVWDRFIYYHHVVICWNTVFDHHLRLNSR